MHKHQRYKKNSIRILPWLDVMRSMFWAALVVRILAASCNHFGYLEEFWKEVTLCFSWWNLPSFSMALHHCHACHPYVSLLPFFFLLVASTSLFPVFFLFLASIAMCYAIKSSRAATPVVSAATHGENFGWTHVWVFVNGHDFGGFDCCNLGSCCDAVVR